MGSHGSWQELETRAKDSELWRKDRLTMNPDRQITLGVLRFGDSGPKKARWSTRGMVMINTLHSGEI